MQNYYRDMLRQFKYLILHWKVIFFLIESSILTMQAFKRKIGLLHLGICFLKSIYGNIQSIICGQKRNNKNRCNSIEIKMLGNQLHCLRIWFTNVHNISNLHNSFSFLDLFSNSIFYSAKDNSDSILSYFLFY